MMNFTYETQGANTYLVYQVMSTDEIDSMSLGMLTNNKIPGLAQLFVQQIDMEKYLKYNISSKVSVKQFFTGVVNRKRLLSVLSGIVNALLSAEDYMLDMNTILLDLEYIFVDVSTCETDMICMPLMNEKTDVDLGMYFKNIIFTTQFDQTENCDHVAKLINYLNSMSTFSLTDFKKILDELQQVNGNVAVPVGNSNVAPTQPVNVAEKQPATPVMSQQPVTPVAPQQPVTPVVPQKPIAPVMPQQPIAIEKIKGKNKKSKSENVQPENAMGFKIPTKAVENAQPEVNVTAENAEEEKISWFYLMQHYNKENAAKYKAQKEAKKEAGKKPKKEKGAANMGVPVPGMPVPQPNQPGMPMGQPGKMNTPGFAVPGQAANVNTPPAAPVPPVGNNAQLVQPVTPVVPQQNAPIAPPTQQPVQPTVNSGVADRYAGLVNTSGNFGETVVLNVAGAGETTVLNVSMLQEKPVAQPYLIRKKNNERINLDKPVFRIGKERSYVDYFISDNTAISRSHANIISRDGEYFIVDTNSTNHTYVNEAMIQSNVETALVHDTRIRLANEEFEFKLY